MRILTIVSDFVPSAIAHNALRRCGAISARSAAFLLLLMFGHANAGSVAYTYDALGRLATAVYNGGTSSATTVTYNYDASGNWTLVTTATP